MTTETQIVKSIDGLYDEKAEALTANIRNRKLCFRHRWINATLYWGKDNRMVVIESQKPTFSTPWGGLGGIRFCHTCKEIDCIHYWEREITYRVERSKYYAQVWDVGVCGFCKLRILRGGSGEAHPSDRARALIAEVAQSLGRQEPVYNSGYGSGWFIELPVVVSEMLDAPDSLSGEAAARDFVQQCFRSGNCESANSLLYGK